MTEKPTDGNLQHHLPYDDLRGWIAEAERLGELRHVTGASWQEEIGMAAEVVSHSDDAPAVLFDEVPGCAPGFRVLSNIFAAKRKNMTLGFPDHLDKSELSDAYADIYSTDSGLIPPVFVDDGPIFENVIEGDAVDLELTYFADYSFASKLKHCWFSRENSKEKSDTPTLLRITNGFHGKEKLSYQIQCEGNDELCSDRFDQKSWFFDEIQHSKKMVQHKISEE